MASSPTPGVRLDSASSPPASGGREPTHVEAWKRYAAYLRRPPELAVSWIDAETSARAWLIINSSRGGAAGGGTRMRLGVRPREVTYLAKAMELKFALAGPPIGGAKTGIDFDPTDPRKLEVLERWYHAITPILRHRYGTGGDLNVDELLDVIPTFERLGLRHPQEGVVRGHLSPDAEGFDRVMQRMDAGVSAPVAGDVAVDGVPLSVADVVTGYGVATAIRRLYERGGEDLAGRRVIVEGFGNVGAGCALFLARAGARIVAIRDVAQTLVDPDGIDGTGIEALLRGRVDKRLPSDDARVRTGAPETELLFTPADVFVCAAVSESLSAAALHRLARNGVEVIACGANQPFREAKIGVTRVAQLADRRFSVLPDVMANLGMARTFSYLMRNDANPNPDAILEAVERTVTDVLDEALDRAGAAAPKRLIAATLATALDRIETQ